MQKMMPKNFLALAVLFVSVVIPVNAQTCPPLNSGCLDSAFGSNGIVLNSVPPAPSVRAIHAIIQQDNKIVALLDAHPASSATFTSGMVRYHPDGSLDTSFGTAGFVYLNWDIDGRPNVVSTQFVGSEELIVIAGYTPSGKSRVMRVERFLANGSLDTTFGTNGKTLINTSAAEAIAVQPDQKIVLTGKETLVRLNANGSPDNTFGSNGVAQSKLNGNALGIQSGGRIVVGGSTSVGSKNYFSVGRFNSNGSLDDGGRNDSTPADSFGASGMAKPAFNRQTGFAFDLKFDNAGRIVAAGSVGGFSANNFAIARLNANGQLDNTFSEDGQTTYDFQGASDAIHSIVIQQDGKIVVGGEAFVIHSDLNFGIIRFNDDGNIDTTFGQNGVIFQDFFGDSEDLMWLLPQTDSSCSCTKLVAVGYAESGNINYALIARYLL